MRLWHQFLIPHLDRQRLLSQHREACALRGKGWGKKHATVDYVFTYDPAYLIAYHYCVMEEMERRGYHPDRTWDIPACRGAKLEPDESFADNYLLEYLWDNAKQKGDIIFPEHNDDYLRECINLLKEKNAPIEWEKVEQDLCIKV